MKSTRIWKSSHRAKIDDESSLEVDVVAHRFVRDDEGPDVVRIETTVWHRGRSCPRWANENDTLPCAACDEIAELNQVRFEDFFRQEDAYRLLVDLERSAFEEISRVAPTMKSAASCGEAVKP